MAAERLPLHLCNSIKQYKIILPAIDGQTEKTIEHLKIELKKFTIRKHAIEKLKLVLLLMLLMTQNISANSYSGGKNSMLRTRIIGTRYGKLQGVIMPMDQHKYLKPVEAYLGVPYATPPTGSNR